MPTLNDLGFRLPIYERGAAGVPTTTLVTDLAHRISSYEDSITASGGFESARSAFACSVREAQDWLNNGLMRSTVVRGPHGEWVWEGFITQVAATFGQEQRSRSLEGMANRISVRYTNVLGETRTISPLLNDTASQALYGIKAATLSVDATSDNTEATAYGTVELSRRKNPRMQPSTTVASGDLGPIQVELSFAGWYYVLDWLTTSSSSTTKSTTTTQLTTLLAAYVAVNAFLSTSSANITASGTTATEYIAPDTTYRQKIEELMLRGNGAHRYAWGVYKNRLFHATPYAGATPSVITYQRHLGEGRIYDATKTSIVHPWNVRPNAMYRVIELDEDPTFVERVTRRLDQNGWSVNLEPEEPSDLASILVQKYR